MPQIEPEPLQQETSPEETPERPDFLDPRFDSVEAQARAYRDAEKQMRQREQEANEFRRRAEQADLYEQQLEALTQQQQNQGFDPMQHPLIAAGQQAFDNGDFVAVAAALQQLGIGQAPEPAPQERVIDDFQVKQLDMIVQQRYGADDSTREAALAAIETDPVLSKAYTDWLEKPTATVGEFEPILDMAYRLVGAQAAQQEQASLAQQQAEKEAARQRKLEQESLSGAGPTRVASASEQEDAWARIKGAELGTIRLTGVD